MLTECERPAPQDQESLSSLPLPSNSDSDDSHSEQTSQDASDYTSSRSDGTLGADNTDSQDITDHGVTPGQSRGVTLCLS